MCPQEKFPFTGQWQMKGIWRLLFWHTEIKLYTVLFISASCILSILYRYREFGLNKFYFIAHWKQIEQGKMRQCSFQKEFLDVAPSNDVYMYHITAVSSVKDSPQRKCDFMSNWISSTCNILNSFVHKMQNTTYIMQANWALISGCMCLCFKRH